MLIFRSEKKNCTKVTPRFWGVTVMSRQSFLCHDRDSSLSWSHVENFVAT